MVYVPKYCKKSICGAQGKDNSGILRELCRQHGVELVEVYAMKGFIHMLLMIPSKFSVENTMGFLKGKSTIRIFRGYWQVKRNFTGRHFWVLGYGVSAVELVSK